MAEKRLTDFKKHPWDCDCDPCFDARYMAWLMGGPDVWREYPEPKRRTSGRAGR